MAGWVVGLSRVHVPRAQQGIQVRARVGGVPMRRRHCRCEAYEFEVKRLVFWRPRMSGEREGIQVLVVSLRFLVHRAYRWAVGATGGFVEGLVDWCFCGFGWTGVLVGLNWVPPFERVTQTPFGVNSTFGEGPPNRSKGPQTSCPRPNGGEGVQMTRHR